MPKQKKDKRKKGESDRKTDEFNKRNPKKPMKF